MMRTSSEHEPTPTSKNAIEAWQETVAVACDLRQQRGEGYTGRHRPVTSSHADGRADPI
jgi:hypothetical protein